MRRRQFIATTGIGALTALGGCLGNKSPPPRRSSVISDFEVSNGTLVVDLATDKWVLSRYDGAQQSPAMVSPVGVASAKGSNGGSGGRGATGRGTGGYTSAPRTGHGHAWYHGGDYTDDWYDDHEDEVTQYPVTVAALGVAYLGSTDQMRDEAPDAGTVPWDREFQNPSETVTYDVADRQEFSQAGWYRIGANIVGTDSNHDFRWECYDLEISDTATGFNVDEQWKVSPRI